MENTSERAKIEINLNGFPVPREEDYRAADQLAEAIQQGGGSIGSTESGSDVIGDLAQKTTLAPNTLKNVIEHASNQPGAVVGDSGEPVGLTRTYEPDQTGRPRLARIGLKDLSNDT